MFESYFVSVAGWITIIVQIVLLLMLLFWIFGLRLKGRIFSWIRANVLIIAFLVVLGASLGSFVFSEILNYEPCILCWYGRVALYPQVIILLLAMFRRDRSVLLYLIGLSVVGFAISAYQIILQFSQNNSGICSFLETSSDCSYIYVLQFGYITIPVMALTALAFLIFVYSVGLALDRV